MRAEPTRNVRNWHSCAGRPTAGFIYGTFAEREKHRAAVDDLVSVWAKKHTQEEAVRPPERNRQRSCVRH
jgi:hypothetical protein